MTPTLLLVGRSGNGKSSVANSILGHKLGEQLPRESFEVATRKKLGAQIGAKLGAKLGEQLIEKFDKRIKVEDDVELFRNFVTDFFFLVDQNFKTEKLENDMRENQEFVVIDCTGLGDTGSDMAGDIKDVLRSALDAVKMCGTESDVKTFQSDVPSKNVSAVVKNSYNKFDTDGTNDDDSTQENILTVTNNDDPSNKNTLAGTLVVRQSNEKYRGFDALIFVMKYGVRYTKQEKDSVKMIKFIFGENVFQKWGILVFTYGDNFYSDSQITFEDWCREQTGDIKNLFEEVQHRCVIFDNKTVSLELQNSQRSTFSSLIDKVNEGNVGTYQIDGTAGPLKILDKYYTISERNPGHPHEELIELERMINEELAMFSPSKPDEYKKLLELGLNDIRKHQMARVPPKKALCILL